MDRINPQATLGQYRPRPSSDRLIVLKFGGTSLGTADQLRRVDDIIRRAAVENRVVVVASAVSGVTDRLVAETRATEGDPACLIAELGTLHLALAQEVLSGDALAAYETALETRLSELARWLSRIRERGLTGAAYDAIISAGERISVPLLSLMLCQAGVPSDPVDAAALIRTDAHHGEATVDFDATTYFVEQWIRSVPEGLVPVVTGFIGSTETGAITTLGRSGSDYSASILAAALKAERLERWTDVDGLYSSDPRLDARAERLALIVLETAQAWNSAGRLGMHRKALEPLVTARIPVHVRCTEHPELPGTIIVPEGGALPARAAI